MKINLLDKTGRIIRSNINYTLIHKKIKNKIVFLKLNVLKIRYSLVNIYKDLLDSHKKICWKEKKIIYILLLDRYITCCTIIIIRAMVEED